MNFGQVIEGLKGNNSNAGGNRRGENIGRRFARAGWNGKGMFIALQAPDSNSKMSLEYIYMKTADGHFVPWQASQTDMLADDWDELDRG